MKQILPQISTFTNLLIGRVYLLEDADGLTLVDTGLASAGTKIIKQLIIAGHKPSDVKRILITHAHLDHVGCVGMLRAATGAEVWCHALEKPVIEGVISVPRREKKPRVAESHFEPTPVARTLSDGELLPILGGLQVVFTPGHAPGHLSFWHPQRRFLITGDVIFYMFNRMTLPMAIATVDMDEDRRSIQKILDLRPEALLFGHGEPMLTNALPTLQKFASRIGIPA